MLLGVQERETDQLAILLKCRICKFFSDVGHRQVSEYQCAPELVLLGSVKKSRGEVLLVQARTNSVQ